MDGDAIFQVVMVVAAVLAIIGHQQRSIDKLRKEFRKENRRLRKDHAELKRSFELLRAGVSDIGQRLARIEGFLGIGMPPAAVARARRRLRQPRLWR